MKDILLRRRNLLICKQEKNIRAVCFRAYGEQTVAITKVGSAPAITMQYSYDGVTWDAWDLSALPFGGSTKVYVRGMGNYAFGKDGSNYNKITFGTDSYVYVSGIAEALLDGENEVLTYGTQGILRQLFYQQTALRSAEGLRFEAQSTDTNIVSVYAFMFDGCSNLLYAPKVLPANNFKGSYNYQYMFRDCTSLITAPELPATVLGSECYQFMFYGCTSLVNAPELPATTLTGKCYQYMFYGCTSLVNAPELPATTLTERCYQYMFDHCPKLKAIRCRAKVKATNSTYRWLNSTASSGTFYGHSEYGWSNGVSGIPSGWKFVELTD